MGHLEMLLAEGDTEDGDIEQYAEEKMGEPDPYTTHKEPDDVHHRTQTAGLSFLRDDLRTEWPQTEYS